MDWDGMDELQFAKFDSAESLIALHREIELRIFWETRGQELDDVARSDCASANAVATAG